MTSALADLGGLNYASNPSTLHEASRAHDRVFSGANSTLVAEISRKPHWLREAIFTLARGVSRSNVDSHVALEAAKWLIDLPGMVSRPDIGIGDDGSISIEWDRHGAVLHVMFEDSSAEAYFEDSRNGVEWEMQFGGAAAGVLLEALRTVSLS